MILISQTFFFLNYNVFRSVVLLYVTFPSTSFPPPLPPLPHFCCCQHKWKVFAHICYRSPRLDCFQPTTNCMADQKIWEGACTVHWEDWLTNCPRITIRISLVPDVIRSPYIKNVGLFVLQFAGRVSVAVAPGISRNDTLLTHEAFKRTDFSTVEAERKWILVANSSGLWSYDNHGWRAAWKMKI